MRWTGTKMVKVGKNPIQFQAVWGPKLLKFWDSIGDHSCFPTPLPYCLCHVSFSRYSPLSLEVVENRTNVKVFWPHFFQEGRSQRFYGSLLARTTIHRLAKFGSVLFADLRLRSLAIKWNAEFTQGGRKLQFEAVLWTKIHVVFRRCRGLLVVCNACLCISHFVPKV